jgi:hypothetical protein
MNKSLEHVLRCYAIALDPSAWEERLPMLEFAINSDVHVSTGYTPFYLMYGFTPRDPLALLHDLQIGSVAVESTRDMLHRMQDELLCACSKVYCTCSAIAAEICR